MKKYGWCVNTKVRNNMVSQLGSHPNLKKTWMLALCYADQVPVQSYT